MIRLLSPEDVTICPLPVPNADAVACSEVHVGKRMVPHALAAFVPEAAVSCDGHVLLFLSDDIPSEDALRIHLLDAQLRLLDSAWLGWIYATGTFRLLELVQPRTVRFRFFGDTDWSLQVLETAALRVPVFSEPRGVHRRFGWSRHFRIEGDPQMEQTAAR